MGLSRACRDLFNLADVCIENEELDKAKDLIVQALALAPTDNATNAYAVNRLIYAELYSSAKRTFETYRKHTGLEVPLDLTYEDIVQREQANLMVNDVPVFDLAKGSIRFNRLSDLERGSLFSYVTTSTPVEFIEVSEQGLAITQSKVKHAYKWDEIIRVSIVARIIHKGMGVTGGNSTQKICTLEMPGKRFQFDVSPTNPDFRAARLLRTILTRYLNMEIIDERKPGFKAAKDDPIRNLKWGDRIRQGLIVGAILLFILFSYMNAPAPG